MASDLGDGVAAALDTGGLERLAAGRRLLAELQAAYEAADAVEERGRSVRAALFPGDPEEEGPDGIPRLITGLLDGSLWSIALSDVSALAGRLDAEQSRCVLFAAAAQLASGTALPCWHGMPEPRSRHTGHMGNPDARIAATPEPPYVAVIFTSLRTDGDHGYAATAVAMADLAARQPGYLGVESARDADGLGITVSYWTDENAARDWKHVAGHLLAQRAGRETWYREYQVRVATVSRDYGYR